MTIAASQNYTVFDGDGVTKTIPYTFAINTTDGSDIQVYYIDSADTVTLLTGNYSVDVANSRVLYPTASGVAPLGTTDTAVPVGAELVVMRTEPLSQTLALANQSAVPLTSVENEFDKLTMICQQLQEQINRCFKLPPGSAPSLADVTVNSITIATATLVGSITLSATYANLKAHPPAALTFAWATDLGAGGVLMFYSGNANIGDQGWFETAVGQ